MSCLNPLHQRLSPLAHGELGREPALELLAHVEVCPNCARDLDLYADLVTVAASPLARPVERLERWRSRAPKFLFVIVVGFALLGVIDQVLGPTKKPDYAALAERTELPALDPNVVDPYASELAAALVDVAREDWASVVTKLDAFLDLHPDHAVARFQRAVAQRTLGRFDAARTDLRLLREATQGPLRDDAEWALVHLELAADDPRAALALLDEIERRNGAYAGRAIELAERVRAVR